ncbi:hypothetical protein GX48_06451 [Paracoccidioides brasiliensis]|nr:hypothetical protein GX48_06451 [Paracoccidioides brasiliensis]
MGKPPAVVIIARHGARLDAVDNKWHLTSPTPYDPPLTYGGWNQARALGIRIGNILRAREDPSHSSSNSNKNSGGKVNAEAASDCRRSPSNTPRPSRKQKVIFHTSPFLRCVQTAIGVGAGMRQSKGYSPCRSVPHTAKPHTSRPGSPTTRDSGTHYISTISQPIDSPSPSCKVAEPSDITVQKYKLRLDAFLGEWLSPDYFEHIAPPPSSVMMVASAKSELLRRGEPIETGIEADGKSMFGHFPGGWSNPFTRSTSRDYSDDGDNGKEDDGVFKGMASMGYTLAQRNCPGSVNNGVNEMNKPEGPGISKFRTDLPVGYSGYIPPIAVYAVSPSDPIPSGYVSHARDSCIDVDYQWDSMREPQNWGKGGEYGEEWSSMHRRFRNGLQHMIDWYRSNDPGIGGASTTSLIGDEDDDDIETVLILITHGAGCNALIGALTGQPVLLDVGMASLTMAERKTDATDSSWEETPASAVVLHRPLDSRTTELADEYNMKLISSTEHLRTEANSSHVSHTSSARILPTPISSYRHRFSPTSDFTSSQESFSLGESMGQKPSNSRILAPNYSVGASANRPPSGLWGSVQISGNNSESADDLVPNFEDPKPSSADSSGAMETDYQLPHLPARSRSQRGLWGCTSLQEREQVSKRRWTMSESNP